MRTLIFISCLFSFSSKAQVKGYGIIGATAHIIYNHFEPGGRLVLGLMPQKNVGIGFELGYINNYGAPLLGEFRLITENIGDGLRFTAAPKVGTLIHDGTSSLAVGAEAGFMLGKNRLFFLTFQYLNFRYKVLNTVLGVNDYGIGLGAKF